MFPLPMEDSQKEMNYRTNHRVANTINIVVLGDLHFPFHSRQCIALVLYFLNWLKPEVLILNGDIVDFYALSRFDRDPNRITKLQEELDETLYFLKRVRRCLPSSEIIYMEGNHENRLRRWISSHPEVCSLRVLSLPSLLEFGKQDIQFVEYENYLHRYGLLFHHGDLARKHSGYTAKAMVEKWKTSGISNHTHRLGSYFVSGFGQQAKWIENGCLCSLNPHYYHGTPDWQQGFSVINWDEKQGRSFVESIEIHLPFGFYYRDNLFRLNSFEYRSN